MQDHGDCCFRFVVLSPVESTYAYKWTPARTVRLVRAVAVRGRRDSSQSFKVLRNAPPCVRAKRRNSVTRVRGRSGTSAKRSINPDERPARLVLCLIVASSRE
jgi:hypothetical protein